VYSHHIFVDALIGTPAFRSMEHPMKRDSVLRNHEHGFWKRDGTRVEVERVCAYARKFAVQEKTVMEELAKNSLLL
jgi:hypothetical protein